MSQILPSLLFILVCLMLSPVALARCPDETASLSEACPELYAELDHEGWVNRLDLASETPASAQTVEQLRSILANQKRPVQAAQPLDEAELDQTLAEFYQAAERKEPSFMEKLAAWWDDLFGEKQERIRPDREFWSQLLPSQTMAHVLFYSLSGLILAMIVVYGWREIAPFIAQRRGAVALKKRKSADTSLTSWPPSLAGLSSSAALGKAYSTLVSLLTARKQLPQIPGLTHEELVGQYKTNDARGGESFDQLSRQAGEILFAQRSVSPEQLQQFVAHAEQLVKQETPHA